MFMLTAFDILRTIPSFTIIVLIIHIPLLFLLRKYTKIEKFLKFIHVFFTSIIIATIGILINEKYQIIFLDFIVWYWLVPSLGVALIIGGLYKSFKKSFKQNFYSSFLIMTIVPYI